jgi:hypothetical protein
MTFTHRIRLTAFPKGKNNFARGAGRAIILITPRGAKGQKRPRALSFFVGRAQKKRKSH